MDDITNKRFEKVEQKIDGARTELSGRIDSVRTELSGRIDHLASSMAAGFRAAAEERRADAEERRRFHAEQVQRFQVIVDQAEKLGAQIGHLQATAEKERDRKVAELETTVAELRERLARIEKVLAAGGRQ